MGISCVYPFNMKSQGKGKSSSPTIITLLVVGIITFTYSHLRLLHLHTSMNKKVEEDPQTSNIREINILDLVLFSMISNIE